MILIGVFIKNTMKNKIVIITLSIISIILTALVYGGNVIPYTHNSNSIYVNGVINNKYVEDTNYAGWKGIESLSNTYSGYINRIHKLYGVNNVVLHFDLIWPFEGKEDIFKKLMKREDIVIIIGSIRNIDSIMKTKDTPITGEVIIKYKVYIEDVIVNNAVKINVDDRLNEIRRECDADPDLCVIAKQQLSTIRQVGNRISEGKVIEVLVSAFIAIDSIQKDKLDIGDVAYPFPLLNPGNKYILFLTVDIDGSIRLLQDWVYGLYAYLIKDDRVYSLNYIGYPILLDPVKFFNDQGIYWWNNKSYIELRQEALAKLSIYGEEVNTFLLNITKG